MPSLCTGYRIGVSSGGFRNAAVLRLRLLGARRRLRQLSSELLPEGSKTNRVWAQHGVIVLAVDTMPEQVVRVALDRDARAAILRHHAALAALHGDPRFAHLEPVLPKIIVVHPEGAWLVESTAPGESGSALRARPGGGYAASNEALSALSRLHASTAQERVVDEADVEMWVGEPIRALRGVVHDDDELRGLDSIEHFLRASLLGHALTVARIHGDATAGNFLFSPDGRSVTGILDWEASEPGLPEVDLAHYLLTDRLYKSRRELGANVSEVLRHGWSSIERVPIAEHGYNAAVPPETFVLLAWLHHVTNNLRKSGRYARHRWWIRSNITRVLVTVADDGDMAAATS
jgi:hypothetical protein